MRTLFLLTIVSLVAVSTVIWAAQADTPVNLTYPAADTEMLQAEVNAVDSDVSDIKALLQQRMDNYIAERRGHWERPDEVILRLTPAEVNSIPPGIRAKLGL